MSAERSDSAERTSLPDRPAYRETTATGYLRAVLRYTTDEWAEFLQHDRRVMAIAAFTLLFGLVFSGFWSGWEFTMSEVLPGVVIALLPTLVLGTAIYLWCLAKAPLQLHSQFVARETALQSEIEGIRERQRPDVRLEGIFPGRFSLRADGHACEIRTGPIVVESGVLSVDRDGNRTISQRHVIEFPIVSDLRDGDQEITPELFLEDPRPNSFRSRSRWSSVPNARPALAQLFWNADHMRNRENGEVDFDTITPAELAKLAERRDQPHHFEFDITFWNREHTLQWKRREVLVYEPKNGTAFVRHRGGARLLLGGSIG